MAKQTQAAFARELDKLERGMGKAFLDAIEGMKSQAQISAIDAAIENGDVAGVIRGMNLGPDFWAPLDQQITNAFIQGALWQQAQITGKRSAAALIRVGFNHRNIRAENWTRSKAQTLVTEITDDIRLGIRATIENGIAEGQGVQRIRKTLIGTKQGKVYRGGTVGLHSKDVDAVIKARAELSDPARMKDYLRRASGVGRKLPPEGRTVRSAINVGRKLTDAEVDRIAKSYSDKLLRDRGRTIARTEAHNAFTAGAHEGTQQLVDSGKLPQEAITLEWQATTGSRRTRDSHAAMDGQRVKFGEAFTSPETGARFLHPSDTSMGAPPSEIINCRCSTRTVIDLSVVRSAS